MYTGCAIPSWWEFYEGILFRILLPRLIEQSRRSFDLSSIIRLTITINFVFSTNFFLFLILNSTRDSLFLEYSWVVVYIYQDTV